MQKLVLATAIAAALGTTGARAADMSLSVTPGALTPPSWKGLYVGLLSGYAWDEAKSGDAFTNGGNGFAYGGTLGFNRQDGWLVYGLEADLSALNSTSNPESTVTVTGGPLGDPPSQSGGGKLKQVGSLRARVGVALAPALVYVTGGYAFTAAESPQFQGGFASPPGGPGSPPGLPSGWQWEDGWIAGGGVEFKLMDRVSLKAEGLYFETGYGDVPSAPQGLSGPVGRNRNASLSFAHQGTAVRVGLNYRLAGD